MNQRIIYTGLDREGNECCCIIIPTGELPTEVVARKDVPQGVPYKIVDLADIEAIISDRTFRGAWEAGNNNEPSVKINLNKAKEIAHEKRRAARAVEFAPHDETIAKQIPGKSAQAAEAAREEIRNKYAIIQDNIDTASTVAELKSAMTFLDQ